MKGVVLRWSLEFGVWWVRLEDVDEGSLRRIRTPGARSEGLLGVSFTFTFSFSSSPPRCICETMRTPSSHISLGNGGRRRAITRTLAVEVEVEVEVVVICCYVDSGSHDTREIKKLGKGPKRKIQRFKERGG